MYGCDLHIFDNIAPGMKRGGRRESGRDNSLRSRPERLVGWGLAWSGFAIMWLVWTGFVIFLSGPAKRAPLWPLPSVDAGGFVRQPLVAAAIDLALVSLFGLQHSLMARPWLKARWASSVPAAFERCAFVHMSNIALVAVIVLWQPIPIVIWALPRGTMHDAAWALFALGWIILFAGAWSFGILELLGIEQMRAWCRGQRHHADRLRTGHLYAWLRHPMYVGVLVGVWATPRMTMGHLLLAGGMTLYVLIARRFEERDLAQRFGPAYEHWRGRMRV